MESFCLLENGICSQKQSISKHELMPRSTHFAVNIVEKSMGQITSTKIKTRFILAKKICITERERERLILYRDCQMFTVYRVVTETDDRKMCQESNPSRPGVGVQCWYPGSAVEASSSLWSHHSAACSSCITTSRNKLAAAYPVPPDSMSLSFKKVANKLFDWRERNSQKNFVHISVMLKCMFNYQQEAK